MQTRIITFIIALLSLSLVAGAQIDLSKKIPGIKYENSYQFDSSIDMEIEFYNAKGKLQEKIPYFSHYAPDFQYITIKHQRGNTVYQSLFDLPNNNCLIILGEGNQAMGSAAVMKDNEGRVLKALPVNETGETKTIVGHVCKKYTFDVPEFKGELWMTSTVNLPNDVGILKASKMGKYYQSLPVDGFVMEITSTTPKGRKTVMKTTAFHPDKKYKVTIPDDFGRAINKIDFYEY